MPQQQKTSWINTLKSRMGFGDKFVDEVAQGGFGYSDTLSTASLMGSGVISARNRQGIYMKYQQMMADPVISGALRIHVTAALGGHETSGDVVFIEPTVLARGNTQAEKLVSEVSRELGPLLNKIAMTAAYNAVGFGDAYARLYTKKGKGVTDISVDEMMLPPLVQPYEVGNKTVVCEVAIGPKMQERLVMYQIARLKMPRLIYTPQPLAIEKAWRSKVTENDCDKLPVMPSLVGGSFLADAETQYDKFVAALQGLVGQRVLDSIDESIFTAEVQGMTKEQRQEFMGSVKKMLMKSKQVADDAVKSGIPFLGRIRHVLPVANGKQLLQIQSVNSGGGGGGRSGNISIEDVLFHAKLLSGALGVDLSMLGFADMMSGGLGEGGFFRTSVQAAERSRTIRIAMAEFFNHIIDVHMTYRYGHTFERGNRPWMVNFYGSISALETERERTAQSSLNASMLLVQVLTMAKDAGLDEAATAHLLERVAKLEKDDAKMYAKSMAKAKAEAKADLKAEQGGGFGGGSGGDDGNNPEPGGAPKVPADMQEG